ncbi:hypothetical protein BG006_001658 [Podila minutissima]|uniref:C2 domain-containing protein n=1 Tax=Podila minutissima TaxID=64525 RepID=A0A9P5VGX4_9FUNG|nr:hypothetical protein BG006_001658 [Podila minutissima]
MSRKLGMLVAIPIKGRKLVNRSGGKQSPYIQLKLGDDKKRTKASLIASVRFDVFQNHLDMHVMVIDEGKKNEVIGDGVLLLHEVIDKGELDVWFPIKYKGSPAGDIYFELTFYAADSMLKGTRCPIPHSDHRHHFLETHITLRDHILVLHNNLIPYHNLQWSQDLSDHQDLQDRRGHQGDQDQDQALIQAL